MLPLVIENLIIDYKMGLNSALKHQTQMIKCCKEIHKIEHSYKYDEESECHETTLRKNNMETIYYIHTNINLDEIEMGLKDSTQCTKYWCFQDDRLDEYYKV